MCTNTIKSKLVCIIFLGTSLLGIILTSCILIYYSLTYNKIICDINQINEIICYQELINDYDTPKWSCQYSAVIIINDCDKINISISRFEFQPYNKQMDINEHLSNEICYQNKNKHCDTIHSSNFNKKIDIPTNILIFLIILFILTLSIILRDCVSNHNRKNV